MLAGVLMSDQRGQDAGNLWVWPGTHLTHAEYFREHGPDAFFAAGGYPPIRLPEPEQVTGEAGDLLLAHYLLGHNIGGNTSRAVRRAVYFRIKRTGHDPSWREFLRTPGSTMTPLGREGTRGIQHLADSLARKAAIFAAPPAGEQPAGRCDQCG